MVVEQDQVKIKGKLKKEMASGNRSHLFVRKAVSFDEMGGGGKFLLNSLCFYITIIP